MHCPTLEVLTNATRAAAEGSLGLTFLFLAGFIQVGPNPLSVVAIDRNFQKRLLNFGEVLFLDFT